MFNNNQLTTDAELSKIVTKKEITTEELFEIVKSLSVKDNDGEVNLTPIAKAFGKRMDNFKRDLKEVLEEIRVTQFEGADIFKIKYSLNSEQGTFTNNADVLLEFLRYCDPKIAVRMTKIVRELFATGSVSLAPSYQIQDPIARAKAWIVEQEKKLALQETLQLQAPKVGYFDNLVERKTNICFRDVARLYGIEESVLINWLLDNKYIYRATTTKKTKSGNLAKGKLKPMAPYSCKDKPEQLYFEPKMFKTDSYAGNSTLVTPKGVATFRIMMDL